MAKILDVIEMGLALLKETYASVIQEMPNISLEDLPQKDRDSIMDIYITACQILEDEKGPEIINPSSPGNYQGDSNS